MKIIYAKSFFIEAGLNLIRSVLPLPAEQTAKNDNSTLHGRLKQDLEGSSTVTGPSLPVIELSNNIVVKLTSVYIALNFS